MGDTSNLLLISLIASLVLRLPLMLLEGVLKAAAAGRFLRVEGRRLWPRVAGVVLLETGASYALVGALSWVDHAPWSAAPLVLAPRAFIALFLLVLCALWGAVVAINAAYLRRASRRHLAGEPGAATWQRILALSLCYALTAGLHDLYAFLSAIAEAAMAGRWAV